MKTDPNCIFCKIIKAEVPSHKVYEDEEFFAFLDVNPSSEGHTLLVPKDHQEWWLDLSEKKIGDAFKTAQHIAKKLKEELASDFVRVNVTGTDVPHFHVHLIPLKLAQDHSLYKRSKYSEGSAEALAKRISSRLKKD